MNASFRQFSEIDLAAFHRDGFIVRRALTDDQTCEKMKQVAEDHLAEQLAPVEYEVDVQYPGSPTSLESAGGDTVRRLLHAFTRHPVYRNWATSGDVTYSLRQLFGADAVRLSQCHHNCIMTKSPGYSSATLWHQDNRYWSFDQQNLISTWLAMGDETKENGCLRVIPGSHNMEFDPGRFDAKLFLRPDLQENKELIARSIQVELNKGDVLFFHSRLFHAAGRNLTQEVKLSVVFTYHESGNFPIKDTRSARFPGIPLQGP